MDALQQRYGAADDTLNYDAADFLVGNAGRRRNKTWEMVGMDKVRNQQSQYNKLVHVVLRGCGITIAAHPASTAAEEDEITKANMVRLEDLDLSENAELPLAEVGKLVAYFPRLATLQLCDIPKLMQPLHSSIETSTQPLLSSAHITKLVLNHTGFTSLSELGTLIHIPQLQELHLDANGLRCLLVGTREASAAAEDGEDHRLLQLVKVTHLSLAQNELDDWVDLGASISAAFPALTHLFLTQNALPNIQLPRELVARAAAAMSPDGSVVRDDWQVADDTAVLKPFAFLRQLKLLCIKDNLQINNPSTLDAIRILCPQLEVFRISYSALLPDWNETICRMYVVASMPSVSVLNRGTVRPKERLDSELLYVQRGLAYLTSLNDQQQQQQNSPTYPLVHLLQEKHKDVVLAIYRDGATASTDGTAHLMLNLTLRFVNGYKGPESEMAASVVQKTVPNSLTVGKLKALIQMVFQVSPFSQQLSYQSGDAGTLQMAVPLENEVETLGYYGVSDGATILVHDTSLR